MTLSADLTLVEAALDALEQREARVLVWGLVDAALGDDEVRDVLNGVFEGRKYLEIAGQADCTVHTAEDLLERLKALGLLFEVPTRELAARRRWRTRMAEGLRLLTRLRQLLPRNKGATGWAAAPTLVADYRLLWRPRRYPKRNLELDQAAQALEACVQSESTLTAVRHWLSRARPGWRLSRFQLEAASRILGALDQQQVSATLVSAGTGSGKTLAFYLPALSWLAAQKMSHPAAGGVRILAIYPRNELLKDQLSEVYGQARKFDDLLGRRGSKPISVGVLYGDTPNTLASISNGDWKASARACPFFKCPVPGCGSAMKVAPGDLQGKIERLTCTKCGHRVDRATLHLTRQSMQEQPPDILFTSVEMLNQRMADSDMRHLFGLGPLAERTPSLVLLDEVHVYSGTYGAQVAHLLRRWSHLSGRRASFVGLSATISEGERFFASLVGLNEVMVKEVAPSPDDMESEGAEYMVALRGDPVSQAALLSTSIQTLMLGSRLLDTRGQFDKDSRPFAGWRAFAFTDQMDATNRLYVDLLDAEGRTSQGREAIRRHPNGGLAHLRQPDPGNNSRFDAGQDWRLPVRIGHDLRRRHNVGRTTAYDSGVADHTEVVVATAALEVGYDDEAVGLVLQHKAPRDMAQFLQRKGRAGRTRHMRPWTIMVLSDYGRDRLAYQAYEQFFDPELPARDLPMGNRYVQRMQAVYALLDYLGLKMQAGLPRGSIWRDLSGPAEAHPDLSDAMKQKLMDLARAHQFPLTPEQHERLRRDAWKIVKSLNDGLAVYSARYGVAFHLRRRYLQQRLTSLLSRPDEAENLAQHLMTALGQSRQSVDVLLWEHPRPLLLEAAPTALRRLERNWQANGQSDYRAGHPLPEFVPATLFSDLSVPEVRIDRPRANQESYLPVQQALSEMAPGKVSKRYDDALWLGIDEAGLLQAVQDAAAEHFLDVEVDHWYDLEPHDAFYVVEGNRVERLPAFRPRVIKLKPTPDGGKPNFPLVKATSNARLVWRSQVFARRQGHALVSPHGKVGIAALVSGVRAHTHAGQSPATVRRYAVGSLASLRLGGTLATAAGTGETTIDQRIHFRFTHGPRACGVGFEIDVDALRFDLLLPGSPHQEIDIGHAATLRGVRTARYFWEARYGRALEALEPNGFLRHWMAEIFLTAVLQRCSHEGEDLRAALDWVAASPQNLALEPILQTLFQAPGPSDDDDGDDNDNSQAGHSQNLDPDRLRTKLRDSLARTEVIAALRAVGEHLVEPVSTSWDGWLTQVMKHTLAAALIEAIQNTCPQVDVNDLAVDVDAVLNECGDVEPGHRIWITEVNPGGNGLVEQISEALATDPTAFYRQVETALGMSEFEVIDEQLRKLIGLIGSTDPDRDLLERVQSVRQSETTQQAQQAIAALRRQLVLSGHSVFHGYVAALANRVLRPGTPSELDRILAHFLDTWVQVEERLEVEVDARVICAVFSGDARIDEAFAASGLELPPASERQVWRFGMLMGIIWARGHALRSNALPLQKRYDLVPAVTERLLLRRWLTPPDNAVPVAESNWLEQVHTRLRTHGRASVALPHDRLLLTQAMQALTTQPVQMEYLNVYPRLVEVTRTVELIELRLELAESL